MAESSEKDEKMSSGQGTIEKRILIQCLLCTCSGWIGIKRHDGTIICGICGTADAKNILT